MGNEAALDLALPAEPASVPVARRAVCSRLLEWGLPDLVDPVALAVSELATNAVLHARGLLRVTLTRDGDLARLEVADDSPRLPLQRRHSALSGTGRGLGLVAALSLEWGVDASEGPGKVVWALFSASATAPAPHDWLADL